MAEDLICLKADLHFCVKAMPLCEPYSTQRLKNSAVRNMNRESKPILRIILKSFPKNRLISWRGRQTIYLPINLVFELNGHHYLA